MHDDAARGISLMGFLDRDRYDDLAVQLGARVVRDRTRPALVKNSVVVEFEEHFVEHSSSNLLSSHLRFRAALPPPGVPKFRIYPEGLQSFMSKLFGGQDVQLGHRNIDLKFMVKADVPAYVQELWTATLCDRLDRMGDLSIEGEDQRIELKQYFAAVDLVMDPVPGLELLFALGDVDLYGRDVLRALPEAQFKPELGEVWLPGPGDVRLGFVRTDESVSIKARMVVERDVEITDAIKRQFELTGANITRNYEDVLLVWNDHERDPARILRGVDLLRQLAGSVAGDGIFR